MSKIFWQTMVFCLLLVTGIARAEDSGQAQLADLLNGMQSTQGTFEQGIYSRHGQALQTTSGTFALHRPGLFRWQTLQPAPQLLIADGKKVWLYDHDLNQVSWFKEQVNNQQSPAMLLVGDIQRLAKLYQITVKHEASKDTFTLTPRRTSFFEQVQLVFSDADLSDMVIKDNMSQTTRIHFSDLSDAAPLNLFQFTPPKGVDVVEAAL